MMEFMKWCVALAAAIPAACAFAQTYPGKPVRWVVPFPPGGGTDLVSRTIAQKLSETWGIQVVADNRPGSGGTIGLAIAAKTPPDGYTIVLAQLSNVGLAPGFYPRLGYDPVKDLAPITQVLSTPLILVAHPSLPARNARDLIAIARAKPDAITYGSPGNGSLGHLAAEMIKSMAGVKMLHIPYKGASPAITELMGGQISIYMSTIPPALPLITAGTPKEIIGKLNTDIVRILKQSDVQARFASEGGDVVANTPEEFGAFIRKEIAKWSKVIKDAGAKVD